LMDATYAAPPIVGRLQQRAFLIGIVALVLCLVGWFFNHASFYRAYLVAYIFWLGISMGSLAFFMIHNLTGGGWGFAVRRLLESATRTLPLMILLFAPVLVGLLTNELYGWTRPPTLELQRAVEYKHPYLNVPFFIIRAVLYFVIWGVMIYFLNKWSREQDFTADPRILDRMQNLSGPGIVIFGLTATFAAFDWLMSLEPEWVSTIFGMLIAVGWGLSSLAFAITMATVLARREPMASVIVPVNFHDLGNLMLAFVMLWAYLAFSQFLIIWSGNLPDEIAYYLPRVRNGWEFLGLVVITLQFAVPFVLLLSRDLKRHPGQLTLVALLVMIMRLIDLYWLVAPSARFIEADWHVRLLDIVLNILAPVGVGGLWLWYFAGQLQKRPLLPLRDPRLQETLEHSWHQH